MAYLLRDQGGKTLEKIKSEFYRWVQDPKSLKDINDCAKELVLRRRIRAADASPVGTLREQAPSLSAVTTHAATFLLTIESVSKNI